MKSHSPHSCSCKGSKFRGVASVHPARPAKKHEKPDEEILTAPDLISYDQFPFLIDYVCEVFPSPFFFRRKNTDFPEDRLQTPALYFGCVCVSTGHFSVFCIFFLSLNSSTYEPSSRLIKQLRKPQTPRPTNKRVLGLFTKQGDLKATFSIPTTPTPTPSLVLADDIAKAMKQSFSTAAAWFGWFGLH